MLYHLSYIPILFLYYAWDYPISPLFLFPKNASGGVRTHASLDSRSWDDPLRPLGHECFDILLFKDWSWDCAVLYFTSLFSLLAKMHPVGFEPTHLSIAELKSAPLDHSGTNASYLYSCRFFPLLPPAHWLTFPSIINVPYYSTFSIYIINLLPSYRNTSRYIKKLL